jgi:hypothetical protein
MRVVTPLCGLIFVSWPGFNEALALWRIIGCADQENSASVQLRAASFAVCSIASVCSFITSFLLVLGQCAATVAPATIHKLFYTLFMGTCALTTSICCAVLMEKNRGTPPRSLPLRVLTKRYPVSLAMIILLGPGIDLFVGYVDVSGLVNGVGFTWFHAASGFF